MPKPRHREDSDGDDDSPPPADTPARKRGRGSGGAPAMSRKTAARFDIVNSKAEQGGSSKQGRYLRINLDTTLVVESNENLTLKVLGMERAIIEVEIFPLEKTDNIQRVVAKRVGSADRADDLDWDASDSE
jgi:hypothetical protein